MEILLMLISFYQRKTKPISGEGKSKKIKGKMKASP